MPDLSPSALATLCDALHQGQTGAHHPDVVWVELRVAYGTATLDYAGIRDFPVEDLSKDLKDVWRSRAPTWAQPALDGRPVSPPATTQPEEPGEGQGELWSTR